MTLLIAILIFTGCGERSGKDLLPSIGNNVDSTTTLLSADTLRTLYQELMAIRTDSLPLNRVREAGKLYPVDEAPKDTAFFVFREQLKRALARRDVFHVMDIIHPDIKVSFGGEQGVADFVTTWQLDHPEKAAQSPLWETLGNILANGGTFEEGGKMFIAPYVYAAWPEEYDGFEYAAITGSGVRVRSAPSLQSQTLTQISYDIVPVLEYSEKKETIDGQTHPWVKIRLPDDREGYVYGKFIASPIGYRTLFERQPDGYWLMTFLLAGD